MNKCFPWSALIASSNFKEINRTSSMYGTVMELQVNVTRSFSVIVALHGPIRLPHYEVVNFPPGLILEAHPFSFACY
jgi:hypothetical protein